MQRKVRIAQVVTLALVVMSVVAEPALAESSIGRNIGGEVTSWAKALLLGCAALFGLPLISRRDVQGGLMLGGLVALVGGFVFAPDTVMGVINTLWRTVAG